MTKCSGNRDFMRQFTRICTIFVQFKCYYPVTNGTTVKTIFYSMKTNLKNLPAILLLASAIFMLMMSCKKDNNSSATSSTVSNSAAANMSSNAATADNSYDDAFGVALQTGNDNGLDIMMQRTGHSTVPVGIAGTYYCANVSVSGSTFPVTVTVDFGTGCKSADSITRSGSITYVFSGRLSTPGTTIAATFNNYMVNGHKLNGTYTIANTTTNINSPQLILLIHFRVQKPFHLRAAAWQMYPALCLMLPAITRSAVRTAIHCQQLLQRHLKRKYPAHILIRELFLLPIRKILPV